jgi:hypothetical protein
MVNKPDVRSVWANSGERANPGDGKVELGWVAEIPTYQNFNWLHNRTSAFQAHLNERGVPEWDITTEYVEGALVQWNEEVWRSLQANNSGNQPSTPNGPWQRYRDYIVGYVDTTVMSGNGISGDGQSSQIELSIGELPEYPLDLSDRSKFLVFDEQTGEHNVIGFETLQQSVSPVTGGSAFGQIAGALQANANTSNNQTYTIQFDVLSGQKVTWDALFFGSARVTQNIGVEGAQVSLKLDGSVVAQGSTTSINFGDGAFGADPLQLIEVGSHISTTDGTIEFQLAVEPATTKPISGRVVFYLST